MFGCMPVTMEPSAYPPLFMSCVQWGLDLQACMARPWAHVCPTFGPAMCHSPAVFQPPGGAHFGLQHHSPAGLGPVLEGCGSSAPTDDDNLCQGLAGSLARCLGSRSSLESTSRTEPAGGDCSSGARHGPLAAAARAGSSLAAAEGRDTQQRLTLDAAFGAEVAGAPASPAGNGACGALVSGLAPDGGRPATAPVRPTTARPAVPIGRAPQPMCPLPQQQAAPADGPSQSARFPSAASFPPEVAAVAASLCDQARASCAPAPRLGAQHPCAGTQNGETGGPVVMVGSASGAGGGADVPVPAGGGARRVRLRMKFGGEAWVDARRYKAILRRRQQREKLGLAGPTTAPLKVQPRLLGSLTAEALTALQAELEAVLAEESGPAACSTTSSCTDASAGSPGAASVSGA